MILWILCSASKILRLLICLAYLSLYHMHTMKVYVLSWMQNSANVLRSILHLLGQSISRIIPSPIGFSLISHSPRKYPFQCSLITPLHIGNGQLGNKDGINCNICTPESRSIQIWKFRFVTSYHNFLYSLYLFSIERSSSFTKILPEIFKTRGNLILDFLDIRKMSLASWSLWL